MLSCVCVVGDWEKTFEDKLGPLFSVKETLSEEEAIKMGRKDPEQEVEKFVSANTQELGKDKWLCPLSGKKFKVRFPAMGRYLLLTSHPEFILSLTAFILHPSFCSSGSGVCQEAHPEQTRRQDRGGEEGSRVLQQFPDGC